MRASSTRHTVVGDGKHKHELPYSKGLMASSIMATGLAPGRAFDVAEAIEVRLDELGCPSITRDELNRLAAEVLAAEVGDRYAESFVKWQRIQRLDVPLIILLGGATGVGKSTIATMLASRLGITRVIPTDAIREVMRAMLTAEMFPTLHTSSFEASSQIRHPLPRNADPVIIGFREQASTVAVGVEALVQRAIDEGTDLIVEGAHVVPGFLDLQRFKTKAVVVPLLITVDDDERHRSHFMLRALENGNRPTERYLEAFENIRKMHRYVKSLALQNDVAVIQSFNLDATLSQVIDLVVGQAFEAVPEPSTVTH